MEFFTRKCLIITIIINRILVHSGKATINNTEEQVYGFRRCGGAACPYTAAWLGTTDLFLKASWNLYSTKMEEAFFNMYMAASLRFQLLDPNIHYVHHMSMYEHFLHKATNISYAKIMSEVMAKSAYYGECSNLSHKNPHFYTSQSMKNSSISYVALIPFFGGLPPKVSADHKVGSIGQGNSLVNAATKALQTMASICSCLQYYDTIVIGTVSTRPLDRQILSSLIQSLPMAYQSSIHIISIEMKINANLPFHLLTWAQQYVLRYNCIYNTDSKSSDMIKKSKRNLRDKASSSSSSMAHRMKSYLFSTSKSNMYKHKSGHPGAYYHNHDNQCTLYNQNVYKLLPFNVTYYSHLLIQQHELIYNRYERCTDLSAEKIEMNITEYSGEYVLLQSIQPAIETFRHKNSLTSTIINSGNNKDDNNNNELGNSNSIYDNAISICKNKDNSILSNTDPYINNWLNYYCHPPVTNSLPVSTSSSSSSSSFTSTSWSSSQSIQYVYYTESDQIIYYESYVTFQALTAALNSSTIIVGRRKEKGPLSDPIQYMRGLTVWRECGQSGYSMKWPSSNIIYPD